MPLRTIYLQQNVNISWNGTYWFLGLTTLMFFFIWLFPFRPVGVGLNGYTPLHTVMEIFAIIIAGIIFAVGWYGRNTLGNTRLVFCAIGFLGVALLDTAHTLSFKGMPDWVTLAGGGKAIYFWFVARYVAIFSILLLVVGSEWRTAQRGMEWWALTGVLAIVVVSCWLVLWHQGLLPVFLIVGEGLTPGKISMEWLLVVITMITLLITWRKREHATLYEPRCLVIALWLIALSELCFTLYSDAADIFSLMGHVFKVLSYGFLYQAIVAGSIRLPYKLLEQGQLIMKQLIDNIPQVFWMTSVDKQQVLFISPAYETIWQRPCASLLAEPHSWFDAIHPEDLTHVEKSLQLEATSDCVFEYRVIRPDGGERWIRTKSFPIRNASGDVIRIAGVDEDITEQVKAAESLYKKERLLNQTQAIAHLGSWEFDLANNQLTWSDEVYRIFGLLPQEFQATYDAFLAGVHPDDREFVKSFYQNSLQQDDDDFEFEFRIVRESDSETRYVYEKFFHVRDASGKVTNSIGMIHDITERRMAEKAKYQMEMNFRNLINSAPDAIVITEHDGRITLVNRITEKMFGYHRSELLNQPIETLVPKRFRDHHPEYVKKYIKNPIVRSLTPKELLGLRKDGVEFPVEINLSPLQTERGLLVTAIIRDITIRKEVEEERTRLQAQLTQAQKMEAIGHLTGGIAHDFNNVLGAVLGYAGLLKELNEKQAGSSKAASYIEQILIAGNRAKELTSQMMLFSRLSPNLEESEIPIIMIQPVVKEVIHLLNSSIPSTISLNYQIKGEQLRVRMQPVKLHQILLNLAINARDAIEKYGRINIIVEKLTVEDRCSSCHELITGDYVALCVEDTGHGISDDILTKIFDPFFTTKEAGRGTGMGLSVVHGVVHGVGGHILIKSAVINQGTVICILLPVIVGESADTQEQVIRKSFIASGELSSLRIMVVDDEQTISFMLYEVLTMAGAQVTVYNHPADAIAAFKRGPYDVDLVITDETMPGYSGMDMSKEMIALRPELPVILCTGFSENVDEKIAKQYGIAGFAYKPLEIPQMLELILKVWREATVH